VRVFSADFARRSCPKGIGQEGGPIGVEPRWGHSQIVWRTFIPDAVGARRQILPMLFGDCTGKDPVLERSSRSILRVFKSVSGDPGRHLSRADHHRGHLIRQHAPATYAELRFVGPRDSGLPRSKSSSKVEEYV
jgi:hypothetical protein